MSCSTLIVAAVPPHAELQLVAVVKSPNVIPALASQSFLLYKNNKGLSFRILTQGIDIGPGDAAYVKGTCTIMRCLM